MDPIRRLDDRDAEVASLTSGERDRVGEEAPLAPRRIMEATVRERNSGLEEEVGAGEPVNIGVTKAAWLPARTDTRCCW